MTLIFVIHGPISHISVQFHLYFISASFESGDQFLLSSEVLSCFSGVMLSMRSSLLLSCGTLTKEIYVNYYSDDDTTGNGTEQSSESTRNKIT